MHRHPNPTLPKLRSPAQVPHLRCRSLRLISTMLGAGSSPNDRSSVGRSRPSRTTSRRSASTSSRSSASRPLGEIDVPLVEAFIYAKLDEGKAPKSIRNYLGLLHSILAYGVKRGWCESNPVALVEKPRVAPRSPTSAS